MYIVYLLNIRILYAGVEVWRRKKARLYYYHYYCRKYIYIYNIMFVSSHFPPPRRHTRRPTTRWVSKPVFCHLRAPVCGPPYHINLGSRTINPQGPENHRHRIIWHNHDIYLLKLYIIIYSIYRYLPPIIIVCRGTHRLLVLSMNEQTPNNNYLSARARATAVHSDIRKSTFSVVYICGRTMVYYYWIR